MSLQAILDYLQFWNAVATVQLTDLPDKVIWRWTTDGKYLAKSAYNMMHHSDALPQTDMENMGAA